MRKLRNFSTDRCCHLISRVANKAFYFTEEERGRFVEQMPMFFRRYRQQIIQFAIIWCCVAVWQMLVVFSLLGVFLFTDYLLGYMFEIFCFGHILCLLTGDLGYGGGMPFSDWRWITGAVLMLMVSILATFPKNRILRISASLLFVGLLIFGSLGTLANISQHC